MHYVRGRAVHRDSNPDPQIPPPAFWPALSLSTLGITPHNTRTRWPCLAGLLFCNRNVTLDGSSGFFAIIFYVLWDQYTFKDLPIHGGIISPNFFVTACICQLYNPFIASKSFGKQHIKAGIIKRVLIKACFLSGPEHNALRSPLVKRCVFLFN